MSGRTMASQGFARAPGAVISGQKSNDRKKFGTIVTIAVEIQLALVLALGAEGIAIATTSPCPRRFSASECGDQQCLGTTKDTMSGAQVMAIFQRRVTKYPVNWG